MGKEKFEDVYKATEKFLLMLYKDEDEREMIKDMVAKKEGAALFQALFYINQVIIDLQEGLLKDGIQQ